MKSKLIVTFLALAATSFSYALEKGERVRVDRDKPAMMDKGERVKVDRDKPAMMDKGERVKVDREKPAMMDKNDKVKVDKEKGTITREVNKKGDWQVGAGKVEPRPDHMKSEADKRRDQQNSEGGVFIRKTFP